MAYVFRGKRPVIEPHRNEPTRTPQESRAHVMHLRDLDAAFIAAYVPTIKHRVKVAECGTNPGYQAHLASDTPICIPCRRARAIYQREYRERKLAA